jgi:hypothetical protein
MWVWGKVSRPIQTIVLLLYCWPGAVRERMLTPLPSLVILNGTLIVANPPFVKVLLMFPSTVHG